MKPYYKQDGIEIYHGDCRDVWPRLRADVCITDPPYGVGLDYGENIVDDFRTWVDLMELLRGFAPSLRTLLLSTSKIEGEQWLWTHWPPLWRICWHKGAADTRCAIGFKDWESVFVYGAPGPKPVHDHFYAGASAVRRQIVAHPCPKPEAWAVWLVKKFTRPTDVVIDPFMGSGTTLVAAKRLGRKAIGIEIDDTYCDTAVDRLRQRSLPLEVA